MADENPAAKKPKSIVDVAHPGTSAPTASAKPVLVTNRPMLKDPMVVDKTESGSNKTGSGEGSVKVKVNVTTKAKASPQTAPLESVTTTAESVTSETTAAELPSGEQKDERPASPAPEPAPEPEAAAKTKAAESKVEPATEETKKPDEAPPATTETTEAADAATDEETAPPAPSDAEQEAAAAAQAEHDASIQKLIDSKQYFLPINSIEKRKTKRFIALGVVLSVLLAVAWVDIALDAGLIHISGVKAATHFFSN